jgi:lipopolysaccharide export system protein LptC
MSISSPTPEQFSAPERFAEAVAKMRRRSRLIHFLRKALPGAIVALMLVLAGWVAARSILTLLSDLSRAAAVIHMTNPRFYGQDDHGRNFVVSAAEAQRSLRVTADIRLTQPHLKLAGDAARSTEVFARQGVYDDARKLVSLQGDVRLVQADGTTFRADQALIDMRAGTVVGNSHVEGSGPLGQIKASSYAIYDKGARVVFTGQVHTHLTPRHD